MPAAPIPPSRRTYFPPEPPRKRFNKLAIYLAVGIAVVFLPLTLHFQNRRAQELSARHAAAHPTPTPEPKTIEETGDQSVRAEIRQWHMNDVDGASETVVRKRFGTAVSTRDYNVTYGAFLGPRFGIKRYHLNSEPNYEQLEKDAPLVWKYPQFSTIRVVIWKLHESYMTVWLGQLPVEVDLQNEDASATLPRMASDWIVLDNYRVGQELVKNPPVPTSPTPTPGSTP